MDVDSKVVYDTLTTIHEGKEIRFDIVYSVLETPLTPMSRIHCYGSQRKGILLIMMR